jgi:hypothetical protein
MEPIFGGGNWPQVMRDVTAWRYSRANVTNPLPQLSIDEQMLIQGDCVEYLISSQLDSVGTADFLGLNVYTANLVSPMDTPILPPKWVNSEFIQIGSFSYLRDAMAIQSKDQLWPTSASPWLTFVRCRMPTNG